MIEVNKCDTACVICDKSQYKEANFKDKLCLLLHLIFCKTCRDYVRNNRKLTERVQSELGELDPEIKEEIQRKIEGELKKESEL